MYSNNGAFPPPYSQKSAVGLMLGVGNVGAQLHRNHPEKQNTYLSRDGGLNWFEIAKGPHIYEIGDHGALIVMAPMNEATKKIKFSWDEGKSWKEIEVAHLSSLITNIIIEPESISQQFIVYGEPVFDEDDIGDVDIDDMYHMGLVVTLDFSDLHEPQCKGIDNAGDASSDYELWTPFDGRHGQDKCFMGSKVTYVRRKKEALCFNGEDLEREVKRQICTCTDMDYECDAGYKRSEETSSCIKIEGKDSYNGLSF